MRDKALVLASLTWVRRPYVTSCSLLSQQFSPISLIIIKKAFCYFELFRQDVCKISVSTSSGPVWLCSEIHYKTPVSVKHRGYLAIFVLHSAPADEPGIWLWSICKHHLASSASPSWNREQHRMKCRKQQCDARSILALGQPCLMHDNSSRTTWVSALCSPAFQFPRKCMTAWRLRASRG